MRVLVLADGDAPSRERLDAAWPGWDDDVELVIAADGGARHAALLEVEIDRWVGDGDSVDPADLARLEAAGVPIERAPPDKDESDTELALRVALEAAPDEIVILGALGGPRIDHALANLGLPALASLAVIPVVLLSETARIGWLRGLAPEPGYATWRFRGRPGDLVSLLPLGVGVDGVTTRGLWYQLSNESLPAGSTRGLSNIIDTPGASVDLRSGMLLVIESPATLDR